MLYRIILFLGIITWFSCSPNSSIPNYDFPDVVCPNEALDQTSSKQRNVFRPCRKLVYRARYYAADDELITDNLIELMALGQDWEYQPDQQDVVSFQFHFSPEDEIRARSYLPNKALANNAWTISTTEGVIEDGQQVWMHPFRHNQYKFNEVNAFPEIQLPPTVGDTWSSGLGIGQGWGDWEDTKGNSNYITAGQEDITLPYGPVTAWRVNTSTAYDFGSSTASFWYNEDLGFVKFLYQNYVDQILLIELIEVDEGK